jgi:hypothetical protein
MSADDGVVGRAGPGGRADRAPDGSGAREDASTFEDHGLAIDGLEEWVIERAVLNDDPAGREITAGFVRMFGAFMSNEVRPVLRRVASTGSEPQLLVNGLAELLRSTADAIEFPLDHPRSSSPTVVDEES